MTKKTISLAFAKTLCPDFELVQRRDLGRKACMHLMTDGEMCRSSGHFVCELVLYKQRAIAKEERENRNALTVGKVNLLDACPRKYHLLREKWMKPPQDASFLRLVRAFSTARARIDRGLPLELDAIPLDLPPVERAKLRAVLRYYQEREPPYGPDGVTCDERCQFEFDGTWFSGVAPVLTDAGAKVGVWKYSTPKPSMIEHVRQAAVLLQGFPGAESFVLYRMRKPSYRPKKSGETMRAFEDRIFEGYMKDDPAKIISSMELERDAFDVEGVLREMKHAMETVLPAMHRAGMPPNYKSCTRDGEKPACDFESVCTRWVGASTNEIVRQLELRKERA